MQYLLPGPFVVMQGMPGDGMMNTIDSIPVVDHDRSFDGNRFQEKDDPTANGDIEGDIHLSHHSTNSNNSRNRMQDESMLHDRVETAVKSSCPRDSKYTSLTRSEVTAIERWRLDCRKRETCVENDIFTPCNPQTASGKSCDVTNRQPWWSSTTGQLVIFDTLPTYDQQILTLGNTVDVLPAGSTVWGEELIFLDSSNFTILKQIQDITDSWESSSIGLKGSCLFLRITSPCEGYILFNLEGYYFVGFGEPATYTQPDCWVWRVAYPVGAYVRQGLELDSAHVGTVPFGGMVRVTRKTVNGMGLSRLSIEWIGDMVDSDSTTSSSHSGTVKVQRKRTHAQVLGWVSEFLNPLSGIRGPILQPISFPVPALYRVRLQQGAIIRAGVELSSQEIGHAPLGSILSIVGRSFSEHPRDKCIDRLKLAGDAGWISLRLNRHPPYDEMVVEMISVDSNFDPYYPELYHLEKQSQTWSYQSREMDNAPEAHFNGDNTYYAKASEDIQPYYYPLRNCAKCSVQTSNRSKQLQMDEKCLICLSDERTATIVHGETGHVACCLVCARILKARGDKVSEMSLLSFSEHLSQFSNMFSVVPFDENIAALYGLVQATRLWYNTIKKFLEEKGFSMYADVEGIVEVTSDKKLDRIIQYFYDCN